MIRRTPDKRTGDIRITFTLPLDAHQGPISVVGDFNGWVPGTHALAKRSNGTRSTTVRVRPGAELRFRYLGAGGRWFDDPDADHIDHAGSVVRV